MYPFFLRTFARRRFAEKLALAKINGEWYLPLNGAPSTHILKPARTGSLSSLAQNEYICMKLAKSFGLPVPDVDLLKIAEKNSKSNPRRFFSFG